MKVSNIFNIKIIFHLNNFEIKEWLPQKYLPCLDPLNGYQILN
jgi:hypothetical protein